MKVVILAGGYGTRINEESLRTPKPMVEIGGKPILWHIMKYYSSFGYNDFVICCGYKQHMIKEWFSDYYLYSSDVTFDFSNSNNMTIHKNVSEPWKVTLADTGLDTSTGGRIKRIESYISNETFMLTYGDMLSDVNIDALLEYHKNHGKLATVTAINIGQQFGVLDIDNSGHIFKFREKNLKDGRLINGGFMVIEPEIFSYLSDDNTIFESKALSALSEKNELKAFLHNGYWQRLDTQRDLEKLKTIYEKNQAPWKIWDK